MNETFEHLRTLLHWELTGEGTVPDLDNETLEGVYRLAKQHELAHLAAAALSRTGKLPKGDLGAKFKKELLAAVYSDESKVRELDRIKSVLAGAGVDYIPLKGAILRDWYPEPWMRTRCDIDVLVHPEDLDRACEALTMAGHRYDHTDRHDAHLFSPEGVHLELHFELIEERDSEAGAAVMERVWDEVIPLGPNGREYAMPDHLFYFYHLAHMAKHVGNGGCGIRPFLDLWVLNQRLEADREGRKALVRAGGLTAFERVAVELSEAWFGEQLPKSDLCRMLETYIVQGGVYGADVNVMAGRGQRAEGYFNGKVFKPYSVLRERYPALDGKPWLLPIYQVVRWRDMVQRGIAQDGVRRWKILRNTTDEKRAETQDLLSSLELR